MENNQQSSMLIVFITGAVLLFSFAFINRNKKYQSAITTGKGFAVVELYTSEGCSSCPAADAVIAKLGRKKIDNTYVLSFHVDYWNSLGWKDEYSQQAYSARQRQYANYLSLKSVYTPQVIVNGAVEFVGSDERALNNAVINGLNNEAASNLSINAEKKQNTLRIYYKATGSEAMVLNMALVLPEATTQVKRGENGGRTLQHINVVMELKTTEAKEEGEVTMDIPKALMNKPFKLIAFTQAIKDKKVLGADEVAIN